MSENASSIHTSPARQGFLALLTAAALYGGAGVFIRILERELGPFSQVAFRGFTGLVFAFLVFRMSAADIRAARPLLLPLLGYLMFFPVSVAFFTLAVLHTTFNATLFGFMAGSLLLSLFLGRRVFGEAATSRVRIAQGLCVAGVVLYVASDAASASLWGLLLGLLSGIFEALTNFSRKYLGTRISANLLVNAQMLGVLLVGILLAAVAGETLELPAQPVSWVTGIFFGISLVFVTALCIYGFKRFDLHLGTIVLSTELLFASLFGWLWFAEIPSVLQTAGCALLLGAVVAVHSRNH